MNFPQNLTRVHVCHFLSIINGFKNLQNVNQLVCLLWFKWSFPWVLYSTFQGVFPFPDYISSKLKFWETWAFACLCFKTSTLDSHGVQLLCAPYSRQIWVWWALAQSGNETRSMNAEIWSRKASFRVRKETSSTSPNNVQYCNCLSLASSPTSSTVYGQSFFKFFYFYHKHHLAVIVNAKMMAHG